MNARFVHLVSHRPELVGKTGEEAEKVIRAEGAGRINTVQILEEGGMMTMDFREDRVRIFVNGDGIVTQTPMAG